MNENKLREYAKLIVKIGANVQKGQRVRLQAEVDQIPLVKMVTEECYKAGASYVELFWSCGEVNKLHYQYATADVLGEVAVWEEERAKQMTETLPVRIFIDSSDPDELSGISPDLISTVNQMRQKVLKKYRDQIDGKHQWLIVAAASKKWAKKVFPNEPEDVAVDKLWDAIFDCVYLKDGEDAEKIWQAHNERMTKKANWLNEQNFKSLHYTSSNGTDFTVELIPGAKWGSAGDVNHINQTFFVPNMPTEEVFTSPMKGKCEGRLVSTKPLSRSGQVINHFTVDFKDGRVVECHAEEGEEVLKKMGKTKPEDELNCGSCGYNTCREKAIAVLQGKAEISMCLPYLKDKAESFSDCIVNNTPNGLFVLNENLEVQQINAAARKIMNLRSASDILGEPVVRIMDPAVFLQVLSTKRNVRDQRIYLAEYKKYVEETVVYDATYHLLICIMRDVTDEETEREKKENISRQTIEIADKVVDKQMRVVQEIASLLGETAAETKIALTKLKESIDNE